ncbi:Gm3138 [Phodopus roborovskii]|uniref:Gm3138 protein n=1 Tax=Phodopus roborovskii TaxID=109678 RepID=A0AAV0A0R1_PHORO|nr:Gm3138 [Phodopus roborovskii]
MFSRLRRLLRRENEQRGETRVRQKEAGSRSHWKTWRNKCSWGRHRTTREAPSPTFTEQEQQLTEVEKLTIQLQSMTYEQIELRGILDNYISKDLNNRLRSLEMLKKEHKQVMLDLQKLPVEISDALNKCKRLTEENESYIYLNSLVLQELTPLKTNVHVLRLENGKLLEEQIGLEESCEEVKKLFKEIHEISDPCVEQHQVSSSRIWMTGRQMLL